MNCHPCLAALCLALTTAASAANAPSTIGAAASPTVQLQRAASTDDAYDAAYQYTLTFYPRWFTRYQSSIAPHNRLVAPKAITSLYHAVVAINNDTLYASTFLDASSEPVIVTVPATTDVYSILLLDQFGQVMPGIPAGQPGVFALTGPGWQGTLPAGVTAVPLPFNQMELIFRADRYASDGQDMQQAAEQFRANLHAASLSTYLANPQASATTILSELVFAVPFKSIADGAIANRPHDFLKALQSAVQATGTQPLSADEQALSDSFNGFFGNAANDASMTAGAQAAYADLVAHYLGHTLPGTSWINFTDIGAWDSTPEGVLDRAAITEFLQYGNNHDAAVYFHAFDDGNGVALDGTSTTYQLRFAASQLPQVKRFWSVTAYTPDAIELVPNLTQTYNIASYTPGLVTDADGSVTLTLSRTRPAGVPAANWLPVPNGPFNIMLRAYGPEGSLLDNTYVPPPITVAP